MSAKSIMIQGTMSSAGKSFVTAGLCRIFSKDGYRTVPFKSQNMALNSYITKDGAEMGRAQVMQAEAAGREPDVRMNPILLKPTGERNSQVIVNGEVFGTMSAKTYYTKKETLIPEIQKAYQSLASENDIIVLEGAGSPAEINLKQVDIVNMGMAKLSDSPVLLVGDIDRGGVFASLYGTIALLEEEERSRVKGFIINKFRGDVSILEPGLAMLEERTGIPVLGVLPYASLDLDEEDSLSETLKNRHCMDSASLDIAVIRLPRISNFTDFDAFRRIPEVSLRYVTRVQELGQPDLILLPGTKSTMSDLRWLRQNGLEAAILKCLEKGSLIFGICGGFQMLGTRISDPDGVEGGGSIRGMGLLETETSFLPEKCRTRTAGCVIPLEGNLASLSGLPVTGYEIHMGKTWATGAAQPFLQLTTGETDGFCNWKKTVFGTYLHGLFDSAEFTEAFVRLLLEKKGEKKISAPLMDRNAYQEQQYAQLEHMLREHLDMEAIYQILWQWGQNQ